MGVDFLDFFRSGEGHSRLRGKPARALTGVTAIERPRSQSRGAHYVRCDEEGLRWIGQDAD